jgi:hypothetical protein
MSEDQEADGLCTLHPLQPCGKLNDDSMNLMLMYLDG